MKFNLKKRYSLEHLGPDWAGCYLDFTAVTIGETTENLTAFANLDKTNTDSVKQASNKMMDILKDHFVGGKAYDVDGTIKDVKVEDLDNLPNEIAEGVTNFLFQPSTEGSKKLSNQPLEPAEKE